MIRTRERLKLLTAIAVMLWLVCASRSVPAGELKPSDYFSREQAETAARFNRYLYVLFFCKELAVISFLGLVAFSRLAGSYQRDIEKLCRGKRGVVVPVYAFFIVLMIRLVLLPFDALRDLVVKAAFGLTSQGIGGWVGDQIKSFVAVDIWYIPLVILVYFTMRRLRRTWWLVSAGAVGVALIAWFSLSPHLVEPLFYRITPLRSQALHNRLDPLLEKSGLPRSTLYQADSGRKTTEVNAYFSGLLFGKRIVLYDVLVGEADPSEMEFVVAHEIGHWKNEHLIKGIAWATAGAAGCLFLIGILLRLTAGKRKQQGPGRYQPSSLPVFFFWLQVILLLVMPLGCGISRRFEGTADRYALELTQNPQGAVRLFQKAARRNLSDLDPPPLMKFWLYTHPTIPERIEAALKMPVKPQSTTGTLQPASPQGEIPAARTSEDQPPGTQTPPEQGGLKNDGAKDGKEN